MRIFPHAIPLWIRGRILPTLKRRGLGKVQEQGLREEQRKQDADRKNPARGTRG